MSQMEERGTRREQILAAAMAVFARKGFDQTSMDDIAAEAGLSKGGVYWHFKSKEEMILAILGQLFQQDLARLAAVQGDGEPVMERLRRLLDYALDDIRRLADQQALSVSFYAAALFQEPVRQELRGYLRQYREALEALIRQGMERGEFGDLSAQAAALAFMAQFEGLILLWMIDPEQIDLPTMAHHALTLLERAFRATSADTAPPSTAALSS